MIRDIFGARPARLLPLSRRSVNPYRLYRRYLGGAKFFFLPLLLVLASLRLLLLGLVQVRELVDEVLGRKCVLRSHLSRTAGFDVAVRKINRMRKPFFMEALRIRAAVDLAYLGLRVESEGGAPGDAAAQRGSGSGSPGGPTFRDDLDFIGAPPPRHCVREAAGSSPEEDRVRQSGQR